MRANYTFYDDNTLKLTFLNVVPDSDAGNTVFEVEEDELMPLPSILLLNDVHYSGYRVSAGNYTIDYEDGEFGSVILSIELVE